MSNYIFKILAQATLIVFRMQRAIPFLFIFFYINLFFFYPSSLLRAQDSILKETTPSGRINANDIRQHNVTQNSLSLQSSPQGSGPNQQHTDSSSAELLDYILLGAEKTKIPYDRCELLIEIAGAYIELGEHGKSENILNEAVDLAKDTENEIENAILFSEIIEKFIILDKIDTALNLVRYIGLTDSRNDAMIKIIYGYLRQNHYEKALELAKETSEPVFKAIALFKIKDQLSEQKLYDQLVKVQKALAQQDSLTQRLVRLIVGEEIKTRRENPEADIFILISRSKKVKALIALAEKQIALGKADDAAENILIEAALISEKIKSKYIKDECLAQIGIGYVKIGRYEKARAIANSIKIPFSRSELLAHLAAAYVGIKEFKKAFELIGDVSVDYFKEKLITQIIIRHIEQGEEQQTAQIAEMLSNASSRGRAYATVADYYVKKENFYEAFAVCGKIEDPQIKITTLLEIATELQKHGKNSKEMCQQLLNGLNLLK